LNTVKLTYNVFPHYVITSCYDLESLVPSTLQPHWPCDHQCSVSAITWSNSVPNLSEIEQSAADDDYY